MKQRKQRKAEWHRIGGLWIGVVGGGEFDPQELIDALEKADYSHLPSLGGAAE